MIMITMINMTVGRKMFMTQYRIIKQYIKLLAHFDYNYNQPYF